MADLHELKTPPKMRNQQTCELLRDLLDAAEAGDIESVMLIGFSPQGNARVAFSGATSAAQKVGALEILKADIVFEVLRTSRGG